MNQKKTGILVSLVVAATLFQYCSKSEAVSSTNTTVTTGTPTSGFPQLPVTSYNYSNISLPAHIASALPGCDNTPITNPITNDGATLGRVLFYDKNLSKTNTISCGSCHKQDL